MAAAHLTPSPPAQSGCAQRYALSISVAPLGSLGCNKEKCRKLANRFKDSKDPFRIAIVRDMWLTGFDASYLHTMYADKPMQGHGLIQAIACVNRIFRSVTSESPSKISNPCNSNGPHTKLLSSTARPRFTGAIIP